MSSCCQKFEHVPNQKTITHMGLVREVHAWCCILNSPQHPQLQYDAPTLISFLLTFVF